MAIPLLITLWEENDESRLKELASSLSPQELLSTGVEPRADGKFYCGFCELDIPDKDAKLQKNMRNQNLGQFLFLWFYTIL